MHIFTDLNSCKEWRLLQSFRHAIALLLTCILGMPLLPCEGSELDARQAMKPHIRSSIEICLKGHSGDRLLQCQTAAQAQDPTSEFVLGRLYWRGWSGARQDQELATKWFQKAASHGDSVAETQLGIRYRCGMGATKNPNEALKMFERASAHGNRASIGWISFLAVSGDIPAEDLVKYSDIFEQGSRSFDPDALLGAAFLSLKGIATPAQRGNDDLLRESLNQELKNSYLGAGLSQAIGEIAYAENLQSAEEESKKLEIYRELASKGDGASQVQLGLASLSGLSVPRDNVKALEWFTRAAKAGDAGVEFIVGQMHLRGIGTSADPARAAEMFALAADHGDSRAMFALGWMLVAGKGIQKDIPRGVALIRNSAGHGDEVAQFVLANLLLQGKIIERSIDEALYWWSKKMSCEHNN